MQLPQNPLDTRMSTQHANHMTMCAETAMNLIKKCFTMAGPQFWCSILLGQCFWDCAKLDEELFTAVLDDIYMKCELGPGVQTCWLSIPSHVWIEAAPVIFSEGQDFQARLFVTLVI